MKSLLCILILFGSLFQLSQTQTCENFLGYPSVCVPYVSSVYIPINTTQNEIATNVLSQLPTVNILPNDTCRPLMEELICKQSFHSCDTSSGQPLPKTQCKSNCLRALSQCGQTMLLYGLSPPNCEEIDTSTQLPIFIDNVSVVNGISIPCEDSTLINTFFPIPFSCATFNNTPSQCVNLVSTLIFETNSFTLAIQELQLSFLSSLDQLPQSCKTVFTELLCKTIMAECVQINLPMLILPFTFKSSPCRSSCEIVQEQCAQLFAFTNSRPPNCTDVTSGLENYPIESTSLPLANNLTIEIPCAPLLTNSSIPTFDCAIVKDVPELCQPFVPSGSYVFQSTTFTIADQILTASAALSQFSTIPDSCRLPLIEYTCKSIFQICQELTDDVLGPTPFKFGRPPCKSSCLIVQEQCTEVFAFGSQLTPNCSAPHPGFFGQDLNPTDSLVFTFFNVTYEVPCVNPTVTDLIPTFQCQKYRGDVSECNKYVPDGTQLWVSSSFTYEQMVVAAKDAISQFSSIPDSCRLPLTEYTCLNIFQRCEKFHLTDILLEPIYLPHPPCQSVCTNVEEQCSQAFALGNQRPPNCTALHPGFAGQLLTPVKGFEFNFFNTTLSLSCVRSIEEGLVKLFDCTDYEGQVKECNPYVPIGSKIWVSAQFTLDMMIGNASEAISQFTAIPDTCRIPLTEFTCKNIFASCHKINADKVIGPIPFKFGNPTCKSMCHNVGQQCAQIFSFGNQTAPDCDQSHPGFVGQQLYPRTGFSFNFFNETYHVECQKPEETHQDPSFSCEKFGGKPAVCADFIDYDIWVASVFTQETQIELAINSTKSLTTQIPSDCRQTALEFICKSIFQKCQKVDKDFLPVPFYYGQIPCPSLCNRFNTQCAQLFALGSGSATTTCARSNEQTLFYGNKSFTVGCVDPSLKTPFPLFSCDRWLKKPSQCDRFVGDTIYIFSPFSQDAMINLTTTYLDILELVSSECKPFVQKLACQTIFQDCVRLSDPVLPVEFILGKPVCKSVCQDVHQHCAEDLQKIGIPLPNCAEIDPLTKQERYPKEQSIFFINNQTFSFDC